MIGRENDMSKIAIVTDSNSGITQDQAKELGIHVLPMPFMIDGETYYEEITLSQEEFYQRLAQNADISTSQPSPESITQLWDTLLHRIMTAESMSSITSGSLSRRSSQSMTPLRLRGRERAAVRSGIFWRRINSTPASIS